MANNLPNKLRRNIAVMFDRLKRSLPIYWDITLGQVGYKHGNRAMWEVFWNLDGWYAF